MSNVAKLKKKAAEFEQKKQFDKALALYIQILDERSAEADDLDVALFNRVGDLLLRQGNVAEAVNYYEKAVDLYAETGFFNNAIALCNKILRQAPGRNSIYYKLGKISAKKGFKSDAKQNFLEYADRMQKAGQLDEAFRALKEFADLCPDQDDIRLMLADQLAKRERKGEALDQLQTLYERFESEGRTSEARATLDRIKAIDPAAEPRAERAPKPAKGGDLVFLDVDFGESKAPARPAARPEPRNTVRIDPPAKPAGRAANDLPFLDVGDVAPGGDAGDVEPLRPADFAAMRLGTPADGPAVEDVGADRAGHDLALPGDLPMLDLVQGADAVDARAAMGVEPTAHVAQSRGDAGAVAGFEGTMLDDPPARAGRYADEPSYGASLEVPISDLPLSEAGASLDGFDMGLMGDDDGLLMIDDVDDGGAIDLAPLALPDDDAAGGDLPMLDEPPPARPTVALTPAQRAAADAAARQKAPAPSFAADFDAASLGLEAEDVPLAAAAAPAPARTLDDMDGRDSPLVDMSLMDAVAAVESGPAASDVARLRAAVASAPDRWELRRSYAEALFAVGDREQALEELERTMVGLERAGDLDGARSVVEEIVRATPDSVRHHQKLVEYAFRRADRPRLVDAYLALGDALVRSGQADKARVVYQRVQELAPEDVRIAGALAAVADEPAPAPPARPAQPRTSAPPSKRYTAEVSRPMTPAGPPPLRAVQPEEADFINLGDMLRADERPKNTRMVVAEQEPTGDEQADFADMLKKFKQGVAANVDEEDYDSHYDLGVAYKEMGLVDEAVAEFQKALRGPERRVRTYEALGQCFLEKKQYQVAATILQRALAEPGQGDEQLVGVLYLIGYASEALQRYPDALTYYQRVFAVDIQFRDVVERLGAVEKVAR